MNRNYFSIYLMKFISGIGRNFYVSKADQICVNIYILNVLVNLTFNLYRFRYRLHPMNEIGLRAISLYIN